MTKISFTLFCLGMLAPVAAAAQTAPITVSEAYARSSNPQAGAAFMVLHNAGSASCTLRAVQTPVTARAALHGHVEQDGVMKMVPVEGIEIAPGGDHALQRGGDHVMLMGLAAPLKDGDVVPLRLDFGDCGQTDVQVPVDNARGMPAAAQGGTGHGAMNHGTMNAGAMKSGAMDHGAMDHGAMEHGAVGHGTTVQPPKVPASN